MPPPPQPTSRAQPRARSSAPQASDDDLRALLERLPCLRNLQLNFCAALTDSVLDTMPRSLERVEALGCERFTWSRLQQLRDDLELAAGGGGGGGGGFERLRCDDSLVLSVGSERPGSDDFAHSLFSMLCRYRAEEARTS